MLNESIRGRDLNDLIARVREFALAVTSRADRGILAILLLTATIFDENKLPLVPIGVGRLYISEVIFLALVGIILLRRVLEPQFRLVHTPLDVPLLAFWGIAVLSTVIAIFNGSVTFHESLGELRTASGYLIFFAVTNLVRTRQQLRFLLKAMAWLSVLVAVAMLIQNALGASTPIIAGRVETLQTEGTWIRGITRVIPPGESLLIVAFVIGCALLPGRTLTRANVVRFLVLALFAVALVLTFFRHYVISLGAVLALLLLLSRGRERVRLVAWLAVPTLLLALLLAVVLVLPAQDKRNLAQAAIARVSTLASLQTYENPNSSLRVRDVEYVYAVPQILSHPIGIGAGAEYRPWVTGYDWPGFDGRKFVHNAHVYMMLKYGVVGYFFIVWVLAVALWGGYRYWRANRESQMGRIVLGIMLVLLVILASSIVEAILMAGNWTPVIGVLLGVIQVILRLGRAEATA